MNVTLQKITTMLCDINQLSFKHRRVNLQVMDKHRRVNLQVTDKHRRVNLQVASDPTAQVIALETMEKFLEHFRINRNIFERIFGVVISSIKKGTCNKWISLAPV